MLHRTRRSQRMTRVGAAGLSAVLFALCGAAGAADVPLVLRRGDQAAIDLSRRGPPSFLATDAGAPAAVKSVTLGVAHVNDQDGGHALSMPYFLEYRGPAWDLISGDGYSRGSSGSQRFSGFGDVSVLAQYPIGLSGSWILVPGLGLTLPVGGQVGSKHLGESGRLALVVSPSDRWTWAGVAVLSHSGGTPAGISSYATTGIARGQYDFGDGSQGIVLFTRTNVRGAGGSSALVLEYDFSIGSRPVALSAIQGLTAGKRSTTIELDLTF